MCVCVCVFLCSALSLDIKRMVYRSVVLSVLLYGSETWTIKARQLHRLNIFHGSCVRAILGVSRTAQWVERLTNIELARRFGMSEDMAVLLRQRRMRWLGHMARMDDDRARNVSCLESCRLLVLVMDPSVVGGIWC